MCDDAVDRGALVHLSVRLHFSISSTRPCFSILRIFNTHASWTHPHVVRALMKRVTRAQNGVGLRRRDGVHTPGTSTSQCRPRTLWSILHSARGSFPHVPPCTQYAAHDSQVEVGVCHPDGVRARDVHFFAPPRASPLYDPRALLFHSCPCTQYAAARNARCTTRNAQYATRNAQYAMNNTQHAIRGRCAIYTKSVCVVVTVCAQGRSVRFVHMPKSLS